MTDAVEKEYENKKRRINQINLYYSTRYRIQKNIAKEITIFLLIILIIAVLGKFILPDNIVKIIIIVLSSIAIIRALYNTWDLNSRSPYNIDEYIFIKDTKYV